MAKLFGTSLLFSVVFIDSLGVLENYFLPAHCIALYFFVIRPVVCVMHDCVCVFLCV